MFRWSPPSSRDAGFRRRRPSARRRPPTRPPLSPKSNPPPQKQVEDPKRLLCLHGGSPSQLSRDALTEIARLREASASREAVVKLSRRNADARPFEQGGELPLEFMASKAQAGAFALASHSKKRPHNVVLGRMFDGRMLDCVELGVSAITPVQRFGGAAASVQAGNRPCVLFAGGGFDSDPALRAARSMLLDLLRGRQVGTLDLASLDRVVLALAPGAATGAAGAEAAAAGGGQPGAQQGQQQSLALRQYAIRLKKSGTPIPRVALVEIGPRLDFVVRRHRAAPSDLEREALRQPPKPKSKKVRSFASVFVFWSFFFCSVIFSSPRSRAPPADEPHAFKYSDTSCLRSLPRSFTGAREGSLSTPMLPYSDGRRAAFLSLFFFLLLVASLPFFLVVPLAPSSRQPRAPRYPATRHHLLNPHKTQ